MALRLEREQELPKEVLREKDVFESLKRVRTVTLELGPTPPETIFSFAPKSVIDTYNAMGAPGRYPHWTHQQEFYLQKKLYDSGVLVMHGHVTSTDPVRAYIPESYSRPHAMLTCAYQLAEADFYRHNRAFDRTDRDIQFDTHADIIREYKFKYGEKRVDEIIDAAYELQGLIDPHAQPLLPVEQFKSVNEAMHRRNEKAREKIVETPYDDLLGIQEKQRNKKKPTEKAPFPAQPIQDILGFVAVHSTKLEDFERDILLRLRQEFLYLAPRERTKIMRAGYQAYLGKSIMEELSNDGDLTDAETLEWKRFHAAVVANHSQAVNLSWLSMNMWEDIVRKYNGFAARYGTDRNYRGEAVDPASYKGRDEFNPSLVKEFITCDQDFFMYYLTPQLVHYLDFTAKPDSTSRISTTPAEKTRETLIRSYDNGGAPLIEVGIGGGDHNGNGELYLEHRWNMKFLDVDAMKNSLTALNFLWGKPVHLKTRQLVGFGIGVKEVHCVDGKVSNT